MEIENITIGQARAIAAIFGSLQQPSCSSVASSQLTCAASGMIGKKVIIRTYSAGVFFGTLAEKQRGEVILSDARRLWRWFAIGGISLSEVAMNGVVSEKSKVASPVKSIWLEAIEIIPCSDDSIKSIEGCKNATA